MELFKFNYVTDPTVLEQGELINGITSVMWVERYSEPGEFEIVSQLSSGLLDFLPVGTLISHADTMEVMIVENHEIAEKDQEDPTLVTTGRTFETILENRIVGLNLARASSTMTEYALASAITWTQAVQLINDHINSPPANANDVLVNVTAASIVTGSGTTAARTIQRGDLLARLREVLAIDDLGIKTIRRNVFGLVGSPSQTILTIYRGQDKTSEVIFSWKAGDLEETAYLFSNKRLKTTALVQGRYINTVVDLSPTKYDRRVMIVNADDIDGDLSAAPTGAALTAALGKMTVRGQQALANQLLVNISRADISKTTKYKYRRDFNVGDLVMLDGNFGEIAVMRVVEYVEIEDENGESGHPTLQVPGA